MGETEENKIKRILWIWGNHKEICKEKKRRIKELEQLRQETREARAIKISNMPKLNSKNYKNSITEDLAIKNIEIYENAIKRLENEITEILEITAIIDCWISFLTPDEAELITLRYKDGYNWDYIPEIVHKSRMQCFRIHNKIIKNLNQKNLNEINC